VAICVVQVDVAGDAVIRHGRVLRGAATPPHVGGEAGGGQVLKFF
jgi:hypothetical protein